MQGAVLIFSGLQGATKAIFGPTAVQLVVFEMGDDVNGTGFVHFDVEAVFFAIHIIHNFSRANRVICVKRPGSGAFAV